MKKKWFSNLMFIIVFILVILVFSFLKSIVDEISLLKSSYFVLVKIVSSVWSAITIPAIFIAALVALVLWKYQPEILAIIPNIREIKAGSISASFENTPFSEDKPLGDLSNSKNKDKALGAAEDKEKLVAFSQLVGKGSIAFLLDIDGKILTLKESVEKFKIHVVIFEEKAVSARDEQTQYFYYYGAYSAFMSYVGSKLIKRTVSENKKTAYYSLKVGSKEILNARMKELEKPKVGDNVSTSDT